MSENLQLRQSGKPVNQDHYAALEEAVAKQIQEYMQQFFYMIPVPLPVVDDFVIPPHLRSLVFLSSYSLTRDTLLILLCGGGGACAGTWSVRLCIEDSYYTGSVMPFLEWAQLLNMNVLVLNPNCNTYTYVSEGMTITIPIPCAENSIAHVICAWDSICMRLMNVKHIAMVAHCEGRLDALHLIAHREGQVLDRLQCIAFTASAHRAKNIRDLPSEKAKRFVVHECVNWVCSAEELDTLINTAAPPPRFFNEQNTSGVSSDSWSKHRNAVRRFVLEKIHCKEVSAGTTEREGTTMAAFTPILEFIEEKLTEAGWEPPGFTSPEEEGSGEADQSC